MSVVPVVPQSRGPLSERLLESLRSAPAAGLEPPVSVDVTDPLTDDDLNLSLYACYELHYRGFDGVDPDWEWQPSLVAYRRELEHIFEEALVERVPRIGSASLAPEDMDLALREIEASDDG